MYVKSSRILKNGAIAGYVYYSKEKKWKWRIIGRKQKGGVSNDNPFKYLSPLYNQYTDTYNTCHYLTDTLLVDIFKISFLILDNFQNKILIFVGNTPAYFAACLQQIINYKKIKIKILNVPFSGNFFSLINKSYTNRLIEINQIKSKLDNYCLFLLNMFKSNNINFTEEYKKVILIDFSIRGESINDFSEILQYYLSDRSTINSRNKFKFKFVNTIDTYRFKGSNGPEIKSEYTGRPIMSKGKRVHFNKSVLKDVDLVGCIVSDNMELFANDGLPRLIPYYHFSMWLNPPNMNSIKNMENCLNKLIKFTKFRLNNVNYKSYPKKLRSIIKDNNTFFQKI